MRVDVLVNRGADGRFGREIATGATGVRIAGDLIRVTLKDGRVEEYCDGRKLHSYQP